MCEHDINYKNEFGIGASHWADVKNGRTYCPTCQIDITDHIMKDDGDIYRCRNDGSCMGHDSFRCPCCDRIYDGDGTHTPEF